MWLGTVVHKAVEYLLKQHRQGVELESLEYYLDLITKRMRKDYGDSINQKYTSRPSKIVGLFEHHYRESIDPDVALSPLFKDVFLFHWKEESQHAIID